MLILGSLVKLDQAVCSTLNVQRVVRPEPLNVMRLGQTVGASRGRFAKHHLAGEAEFQSGAESMDQIRGHSTDANPW